MNWLDANRLSSAQEQEGFLEAISNARFWVQKCGSKRSRFFQQSSWGGGMFGAFTRGVMDRGA